MRRLAYFGTVACLVLLAGCGSSYHARDMKLQCTLVNPAVLEKGTGDQALYRYINHKVDVLKYNKILLDPVVITKDGTLDAETRANYQRLANNAYVFLSRELGKDYKLVKAAEPDCMRVQMGIMDADPSQPVRNVLASLTPIGMAMNLVEYSTSGKQSGAGEISVELKVTDAQSGELLGAMVDRRVGGEHISSDTWSDADAGLQWWAKRMRYVLCMGRSPKGCVKPD